MHNFFSFKLMSSAYCQISGIIFTVLHRLGVAMRRWDSSLRSHRAWWSQCQHACSGLNKTLFASAGPNSLQRGHQQSTTFVVTDSLHAKEDKTNLHWAECGQTAVTGSTGHWLQNPFRNLLWNPYMPQVFRLTLFFCYVTLPDQSAFFPSLALTQNWAKVVKNAVD